MESMAFMQGIILFYSIFAFASIGIGILCLVLFVKLATRGIKALDIYIANNQKNSDL